MVEEMDPGFIVCFCFTENYLTALTYFTTLLLVIPKFSKSFIHTVTVSHKSSAEFCSKYKCTKLKFYKGFNVVNVI